MAMAIYVGVSNFFGETSCLYLHAIRYRSGGTSPPTLNFWPDGTSPSTRPRVAMARPPWPWPWVWPRFTALRHGHGHGHVLPRPQNADFWPFSWWKNVLQPKSECWKMLKIYFFNWLDKFIPGLIVSALRASTIAPTLSLRLRLSLSF